MEEPVEIAAAAVRKGAAWRAASEAAGLALATAYRGATRRYPELAGRRPRLSRRCLAAVIRDLRAGRGSYRAIAARHGCGRDTVRRLAAALVRRCLERAGLEPIARAAPRRCRHCGAKITTAQCLACALESRP